MNSLKIDMDEILAEVKTLDVAKLREKLIENGVKVGPIAPTTISLFQKRLAKQIFQKRGGVIEGEVVKVAEPVRNDADNVFVDKEDTAKSIASDFYYAVCLPETEQLSTDGEQLVFSDKDLALKTVKKYTGSRFKGFKSEQEAKDFSRFTAESAFQSPRRPSKEDTPRKETSSESSPYKAPKPQDLAKLRKVIEAGDENTFTEQVWNNPRYLVSSGDTPAMYQEGPRYTAMHVAAIKNKPEICRAILSTLENPEFMNKLYCQSKHTVEALNSRINFLVDLYLNMPDKGSCESPLHMACKFGNEKVVEILVAHPQTDKQLKNKWGDLPKDIICSRCSTSSPSVKKKIEDLLQERKFAVSNKDLNDFCVPKNDGQCYIPLMRSEDNTMQPLIGQPWSPDVSKSTEMLRITHSPRDPSISVRACAGPMSPTDAGLFHKRWTTPPSKSQSPDQAKAYFNIKRSDSEKGMERIGRQLAHELNIPWSEYWEFLDQFVDLTSGAGLDLLEGYLKKRVWLNFVKDFKEKFGITEQTADFTELSTPVTDRLRQKYNEDHDTSFDSIVTRDVVGDGDDDRSCTDTENRQEKSDGEKEESDGGIKSASNVLSPMSELSNCFAKLRMEDSWSEKATIDSSEKSLDNVENSDEVDGGVPVSKVGEGKGNNESKLNNNEQNVTCNMISSSDKEVKKEMQKSDGRGDILRNSEIDACDTTTSVDLNVKRFLSIDSSSTASYETAAEDVSDGEHTFCSQSSEPGNVFVVIRIKESAIISKLTDYVSANESESIVNFVVQVKDFVTNRGMKVSIVSVPVIDNVDKLLLLEDIDVAAYDGDLSTVQDGEMVELGTSHGVQDDNQSVMAYLTRAVTLPQTKYIYGPQPTREDLNVSRAVSDAIICPELHPHVFHWKISLSRFLRDTNYRWQSPAKLPPRLKQGSPQPSPLGKLGPLTQYGSPMSGRGEAANALTSDIRTKLFPSIME